MHYTHVIFVGILEQTLVFWQTTLMENFDDTIYCFHAIDLLDCDGQTDGHKPNNIVRIWPQEPNTAETLR